MLQIPGSPAGRSGLSRSFCRIEKSAKAKTRSQIRDKSNRPTRIPRLSSRPDPWFEAGEPREALRRDPSYTPAKDRMDKEQYRRG